MKHYTYVRLEYSTKTNSNEQPGAFMASAVLKDYGIIDGQNKELIINRSKVRRGPEKKNFTIKACKHHQGCNGYILTEKKDITLTPKSPVLEPTLSEKSTLFSCRSRFKLCWSFHTKQWKGKRHF